MGLLIFVPNQMEIKITILSRTINHFLREEVLSEKMMYEVLEKIKKFDNNRYERKNCMNFSLAVLEELQILENFSEEYKVELKFLSKKIRKDIWNSSNTEILSKVLGAFNLVFGLIYDNLDYFDLNVIFQYVVSLSKYGFFINPSLDAIYYRQLVDDIQMENARKIVEKQWTDIYNSEDGLNTFVKVFDDIFSTCISLHNKKFFHELKSSDELCRVVGEWGHKTDRFIPWTNKVQNRWNPPGRTYLYLSFSEKNKNYSEALTLNEYICLEEYRSIQGKKYSFCRFKSEIGGNILDLSYNDVSFKQIRKSFDDYQDNLTNEFLEDVMSDQNKIKKYSGQEKKIKKYIKERQKYYQVDKAVIEEAYAKQYLKLICSCIYKKVDEKDENKKEEAYKAFHILSEYLELKGVTGIIYPCTRTDKMVGKNLVLFNIYDAKPIENSIKEIVY